MSGVTVVWSMIAAACLTLAAVHFPVWLRNHDARPSLAFSLAAACTAAIAYFELRMLHAQTVGEFVEALKWAHVPVVLLMLALAGFVYQYLDAGWRWLAIGAIGVRLVSLILNFTTGANLNYLEVTRLAKVPFFGESVSAGQGVPNPWMAVGQFSVFLLCLFFLHASWMAWRRGRRSAALIVGGSCVVFAFAGVGQAILVYWSYVSPAPSTLSLFALGVVAIMGYALSADLMRSRELVVELRQRERDADLAADAANLGIWTRDIVRDELSVSKKFRELFGFAPGDKLGTEQVVQRIHFDDRAAFRDRLSQAARRRGDYQSEFRLVLPGGKMRWIATLGRVDFDAKGQPLRSRGACIDITARKQAEQEMMRLRQDIAHVGRVSVMGQISSALAHEINQPLGAILRNAEAAALYMQHETPDLHEISAILEDIRKDDQRACEVIDRIRALLRREEVAMVTLNVRNLLDDVSTLLRPDAALRHITLEVGVAASVPAIRGDQVQVQQVLLNLILNAMDSLEGLVDRPRSVTVTARHDGTATTVEFSVADTGRGIDAEHAARIFDPFFTTKAQGIGMGLSISRNIVETHGGRLWAEANAAGGATFRFTLPIAGPGTD